MLRIFSRGGEGGLFEEGNEKKSQFHNAMNLRGAFNALLCKKKQIQKQINLILNYLVHLNRTLTE